MRLAKIISTFKLLKNDFDGVEVISNAEIVSSATLLNRLFQELLDHLRLDERWTREAAIEIEIKKNIVRGALRYSTAGIQFSSLVAAAGSHGKKFPFYTLAYPMIHVPGDLSERGNLHTDQIFSFGNMLTSWTAITEYEFNGLDTINIKNKYLKFLITKLSNRLDISLLRKTIPIKFGYPIQWGGMYPHIGNLNISNAASCACVIRSSSLPFFYERVRTLSDSTALESGISEPLRNVDMYYVALKNGVQLAERLRKKRLDAAEARELISFCEDQLALDKRILSFGFVLLYQRLRTSLKTIAGAADGRAANPLAVLSLSLLFGAENLVHLKDFYRSVLAGAATEGFIGIIEEFLSSTDHFNSRNWQLSSGCEASEGSDFLRI